MDLDKLAKDFYAFRDKFGPMLEEAVADYSRRPPRQPEIDPELQEAIDAPLSDAVVAGDYSGEAHLQPKEAPAKDEEQPKG